MRKSNSEARRPKCDRSGAALMLALWALFLLSAMIVSWALDIDTRMTLSGNANRVLEAEALACSGAEVALHPAVKPGSSVLFQRKSRTQSFETRITGEGGRLNLNWIVAGENPQRLEVLRKYLEIRGIELNDRDRMIDTLLDWVDPDNLVRLNGAEDEGDYHPANALLTRIEDLKRVKGWEEFTSNPDWDGDFTLTSTGPIDLAWASREVLLALPGMTEPLVDQFLAIRRGPDGIDGTADDPEFKTLEDVQVALGFTAEQFKLLAGLVGFKDQVLRVVSVGKSGDVTRTVRMVIRKTGGAPQLVTWKEL
jgi:hypothetical protein